MSDEVNTVGTALLLAAAPAGRGRAMDAASVLPALAAVPAGALTGTDMATVVELADPLDPQTVLTRLRAAATAPGPLTLCLAGQLQLDRRQRLPHLALARSTPTTLRYTGLPWHWLAAELAPRSPGSTTVVADLAAEPELLQQLAADPYALELGPSVALFAHLTPFPRRGAPSTPEYLRHFATVWRTGARPPLPDLHTEAAAAAAATDAILLTPRQAPAAAVAPPARRPEGTGGPALAERRAATVPAPAAVAPAEVVPAPPVVRQTVGARTAPPRPTTPPTPPPTPVPVSVPAPAARPGSGDDPHPAILAAAMAGRHGEASAMAAAWESEALRRHGARSGEAVHWVEVRADLARLAGEPARSCELWIAAAQARLGLRQGPDEPDVEGAVDRAHHQWEQIEDPARARALGPSLVELRRHVPGRRAGALAALQRRMG
ncbi:hypothetical protein [Streptomyces sp. NPDC094032]|uniref:hypothetical protein n=1 Tax=Streptomyces sp. NPDC094032 TaxID=3155308 RepID=UPI00332B6996